MEPRVTSTTESLEVMTMESAIRRAHLTGRGAWVESLDPRRGGLLRAALDRIEWP
ncbi:hypothetical protein [Arthrobacter echini]|uniref:hypothetical protein n=1 Tax=Arthrobacter echini TaxID=1529066 RepID=UPI001651CC30|nr:hypothetical protein [Arthrobacter echini]